MLRLELRPGRRKAPCLALSTLVGQLLLCETTIVSISAQTSLQVLPSASSVRQSDVFRFADFNGDGRLDVVVGNSAYFVNPAQIAVHRNLSQVVPGSFDAGLSINTARGANAVEAADLNGDGRMDIIAVSGLTGGTCSGQTLQAFLNTSPQPAFLQFTAQPVQTISYAAPVIRYGDFLPNAGPEIAVLDACAGRVRFYSINLAAPTQFTEVTNVLMGTGHTTMEVADMDGDGDPDLVSSGPSNTTVAYNNGAQPFFTMSISAPGELGLALADIDLDGRVDIGLCGGGSTIPVRICRQIAIGTFTITNIPITSPACCEYPNGIAFGNVNGDSYPDLIASRRTNTNDVLAFLNTAAPPFYASPAPFAAPSFHGANARLGIGMAEIDGVPGDDLVRFLPFDPVSTMETWRNTTPQVGRPFPGTNSDLELLSTVVGPSHNLSLGGQPVKSAVAGDLITLRLLSTGGTMNGFVALLGAQAFPTGVPPIPSLPALGLHFDLAQPLFLLFNGFEPTLPGLGQGGLTSTGVSLAFLVPTGLPSSLSLLVQGFAISSTAFGSTDGHEIRF